jgi:predicted N-acetyltransferase YhbS
MKPTEMLIRLEAPCDYRTVEELVREAFWNVNVPGCSEHYLAHVLRGHEDFIAGLDFVAVADGRLAGQIMYTNGIVADDAGRDIKCSRSGRLPLLPELQKQGIARRSSGIPRTRRAPWGTGRFLSTATRIITAALGFPPPSGF